MSDVNDELAKKIALIEFCRGLFINASPTDFDDVQVVQVKGRDFPRQPGGSGLHVTFSVSWRAIGSTGKDAHDALDVLHPGLDVLHLGEDGE